MAGRPDVESERVLAVIPRGENGEIRIRRVKLVTGFEFVDVRLWRKSWRGHLPAKGLALLPSEAPLLAAALEKVAKT